MAPESTPQTPIDADVALRTMLAGGAPSRRHGKAAPASANAIVIFLLALGAALEGYALSQAGAPEPGRSESLIWAVVGVAVVFTAWALRARYWWSVSGVIAVALVGIAMGTYGGLSLLSGTYTDATRLDLIGVVAIGVAGIIMMGLLSSAWPWLMTTVQPRSTRAARSTDGPGGTAGAGA
ncbi:MAG TPA: hypothetical protein VF323_00900 [Candidatus Limnocylindrales bacterium]